MVIEDGAGVSIDLALDELRKTYREGDVVLFVGAGVSAAAGLPSWEQLVDVLHTRARGRRASADALAEILRLKAAGKFIDALSVAKLALGDVEFDEVVERELDDQRILEVPEIGRAIAALSPKLRAVLTTNIDHLLERAFSGGWPPIYRATGDMARRRRVILKLHGTLWDRATWVLTRKHYDRAMYNDALLSQAFSAIFYMCPILFVGYGLADDDFEQLLGRVRAISNGQPPRHFALVPEGSLTSYGRRLREDAGVKIIEYPTSGDGHATLPGILRWLGTVDQIAPIPPPARAAVALDSTQVSPTSVAPSPPPPGAPYDARWYVHRPAQERQAIDQLRTAGLPVTIWGPARFGKSQLLHYLVEQVQNSDAKKGQQSLIIEINLGRLVPEPFSFDALCENFAAALVKKTKGGDALVTALVKSPRIWRIKLADFMEDRILRPAKGRVVLAIEEADALWRDPAQHELYTIIRSWGQKTGEDDWSKLRFIFLLPTTSSLSFEGPRYLNSPFNLATPIELTDLSIDQIVEFAALHHASWSRAEIENDIYPLVGGHPFLLHVLMSATRFSDTSLQVLVRDPDELARLFGNQLSQLARLIELEPSVAKAMKTVLESPNEPLDDDLFLRLRRAGLVTRAGKGYAIRYGLFRDYLRRRLPVKQA
jgi:hypothetical protein